MEKPIWWYWCKKYKLWCDEALKLCNRDISCDKCNSCED